MVVRVSEHDDSAIWYLFAKAFDLLDTGQTVPLFKMIFPFRATSTAAPGESADTISLNIASTI